jgi:hypothetical protein
MARPHFQARRHSPDREARLARAFGQSQHDAARSLACRLLQPGAWRAIETEKRIWPVSIDVNALSAAFFLIFLTGDDQ